MIYDLLVPNSGPMELREDPDLGPVVSGLRRIQVESAEKIFSLLREGNLRRKTEATDANDTSSRSHAVLEIYVTRSDQNNYNRRAAGPDAGLGSSRSLSCPGGVRGTFAAKKQWARASARLSDSSGL